MARRRYQRGQLIWNNGEAWGRWREDVIEPDTGRTYRKHVKQYLGEFKTQRLALRELEKRLSEINSPTYKPRMEASFKAFAERWLKDVAALRSKSTRVNTACHIRKHIIPAFERIKPREITAFEVQGFISSLRTQPSHVHTIAKTLRAMNRSARAWKLTTEDWLEGVTLPAVEPHESRYFTQEEAIAIITAAAEPYRTFYWIAAETGIRLGEACALRPSDFNLPMRSVVIRYGFTRSELGPNKSRRARAFLLSSQLAEHLGHFLDGKQPGDFLFPNKHGTSPWCGEVIVRRQLQPLLAELGIPPAGFHAFRHCNATMLQHEGVPMKVRQERLGHMSEETTLVYSHATDKDHRRAADKLGKLLKVGWPKAQTERTQ